MSGAVPPLLQVHLNGEVTTTCRLLKITTKDDTVFGICSLDQDVEYNDGFGEITYVASNGFDPSTIASDLGYSVTNSEGFALLSDTIAGIDEAMVRTGKLDDATWICYLVNWRDLSMSHYVLGAGDLGQVRLRHGLVWIPELLDIVMRLKQPVGTVWSIRCRAVFGTTSNTQTGCGVDLAPLWVSGEVQSVGAELTRIFTGDNITGGGQPVPFPGRVQFLTGDNAGLEFATEAVGSLTVSLSETTPFPIIAGDTYRIRPDCGKRFKEDCIAIWDNGLNFKGEPHTPIGDAAAAATPAAQVPSSKWRRGSG